METFHEGEVAVQERTGERPIAVRLAKLVTPEIVPGARPFLAEQQELAVATSDVHGRPWASLWVGASGFVHTPDGKTVELDFERTLRADDDPVKLVDGAAVGLLAIDLQTRRRLRINGVVTALDDEHATIEVREAFPNCPKYIQKREPKPSAESTSEPTKRGTTLDRAFISRVDTLFVASQHATRGLDASHRGGEPGFVHVLDDRTLRVPDYRGNSLFNTFGNFELDSRVGMALVDFANKRVLSLTGNAKVSFDVDEDPSQPNGGTGRYWTVVVDEWVEYALDPRIHWELEERSPFNPGIS